MLPNIIIAHLLGQKMREENLAWAILAAHENKRILVSLLELTGQEFKEIKPDSWVPGRPWTVEVRELLKEKGVDLTSLELEPKVLPVFWATVGSITRMEVDTFTPIKVRDLVGG